MDMDFRIITKGPATVRIKWENDTDADLSDLGKYMARYNGSSLWVDRENGTISGDCEFLQFTFKAGPRRRETPEEFFLRHGYVLSGIENEETDPSGMYCVAAEVCPVLVGDLPTMDRNEHKIWVPGINHLSDEKSFRERDPQGYAAVLAEHGSYLQAAANWTAQDYRTHESYGDDWYYEGCSVMVYVNDMLVGEDSIWGIPSDCEQSEAEGIEDEVIANALAEARRNSPEYAASLMAVIQ